MIEFAVEHEHMKPDVTHYSKWLEQVAASHQCNIRDITYVLTTDVHVLRLNQQYLKHDYYTDILTFDRSEGRELAGDVYISLDRVQENAVRFDVSFPEEFRRVLAHGLLHMAGVRDNNEKEKQTMRQAEDLALELFHVKQ